MEYESISDELIKKGMEIMKKEGTYVQFVMWRQRRAIPKMKEMFQDLFDRYGQKLDGDPESKVDGNEFRIKDRIDEP